MDSLYAHDPFLAVQHALVTPWLDAPMASFSTACEGWAIAIIALAFVVSRERDLAARVRVAVPLVTACVLAGIAVQILKRVVDVPRPLAVYGSAVHVLLQPLHRRSFPSGHSASIAALATFAWRRYRWHAWPLVLLALAGGLSRVYVGAHWVLDVVAGWSLGMWAAFVAEPVQERGRVWAAGLAERLGLIGAARARALGAGGGTDQSRTTAAGEGGV